MTTSPADAAVELGEILPPISEDHILVRFVRKKYKCIMVFMLFFICAQQMSNTVWQGLRGSPVTADNLQEIVNLIKKNVTS